MSNQVVFRKTPLTQDEKDKKEQAFLTFEQGSMERPDDIKRAVKEPTKTLYLRAPASYWHDIQEIMALSGLSMNAVCLELLRPAIRKKLKELKED